MTKRVRFLNCKREAAGLVRCSGCLFQFHAAKDTTSCPGCGAGVLIDCPLWAEGTSRKYSTGTRSKSK